MIFDLVAVRSRTMNFTILIFIMLFSLTQLFSAPNQPSIVTISNYRLYVQKRLPDSSLDTAQPYIMQGVGWSPAGVGTGGGQFVDWYNTDIPLMQEMHANTLRTWSSFPANSDGIAILDKCYDNGVMVIMTVDEQNYTTTVNYFKDHPAILMWLLGNEWNYNLFYGRYSNIDQCITAINNASAGIHSIDPTHPVATCYGDLPSGSILASCTGPDLWGFNVYRGISFGSLFSDWKSRSSKPMFLTEFGADAYNKNISAEDQNSQAYAVKTLWSQISNNLSAYDANKVCVGGCIFEFNDEWWKAGNPYSHDTGGFDNGGVYPDGHATEEWWGCVDIYRNKRLVFWTMQSNWTETGIVFIDITLSSLSPLSKGNYNVNIHTAVNVSSPELKLINATNQTNNLTLSGAVPGKDFSASFTINSNDVNGTYQLYFKCTTNTTTFEKYFSFIVDTIPPDTPILRKVYFKNNSIVLEWSESSDNISGVKLYRIYRSRDNINFNVIGTATGASYSDGTAEIDIKYYYKISAVDYASNESNFSETLEGTATPSEFYITPMPVNLNQECLKININLSEDATVNVKIFDIEGNLINTVKNSESLFKGFNTILWYGKDKYGQLVKSGIYYCQLEIIGSKEDIKMFVVNNR